MKNQLQAGYEFCILSMTGEKLEFKTWLNLSFAQYMSLETQACLAGLTLVKHASESRHKRPGDHCLFCSQAQVNLSGRASFSPIWPWKRTWTYLSQEFLFSCMKTRGFITHLANCMQSFSSCLRMELSTKMQRRWWPWGSFIKGWHEDPLVEMFQNTNPQPEEVTFLFAITCSVNNL